MPGDENVKRTEAYAREHLANERTHLAYVRTAIALLSFGITLNRVSLFFLETEPTAARAGPRSLSRGARPRTSLLAARRVITAPAGGFTPTRAL
ncbi:DUF202 domain-containing protein [Sorangium sp. So ce1000]|uniref:DUF202 domain-containing protein n=1 Tax=Sorangium sp. So ce1000 TaxID=3133325 RepID=UPI003F62EE0B